MNTFELKSHYSNSYLGKTFLAKNKSHSIMITKVIYGDIFDDENQIILNFSSTISENGVIKLSDFENSYII